MTKDKLHDKLDNWYNSWPSNRAYDYKSHDAMRSHYKLYKILSILLARGRGSYDEG